MSQILFALMHELIGYSYWRIKLFKGLLVYKSYEINVIFMYSTYWYRVISISWYFPRHVEFKVGIKTLLLCSINKVLICKKCQAHTFCYCNGIEIMQIMSTSSVCNYKARTLQVLLKSIVFHNAKGHYLSCMLCKWWPLNYGMWWLSSIFLNYHRNCIAFVIPFYKVSLKNIKFTVTKWLHWFEIEIWMMIRTIII